MEDVHNVTVKRSRGHETNMFVSLYLQCRGLVNAVVCKLTAMTLLTLNDT